MKKIIIAISTLCTVLLSSCFGKTEENQKNSTNSWANIKAETNTGKTENNSWKTEDKTTSTGKTNTWAETSSGSDSHTNEKDSKISKWTKTEEKSDKKVVWAKEKQQATEEIEDILKELEKLAN